MKDKNIGLITILHVNNYGAELQAFALQHKLNDLGYTAEIINYLYYKNPRHKATARSQPFIKLTPVQKLKEFLYPYIAKFKSIPFYKQKKKRDKKFADFHAEFTKISKPYPSMDDLYNAKLSYNIFMVGSDQVWNPYTNSNIEPYFLKFAPENSLKIAYASSFGVSEIPNEYHNEYQKLLSNIDKIGVREKNGVEIVYEISGKKASWVLDPTFLLKKEEWKKIALLPEVQKPYLLLYVLTDSDYITQLAYQIAEKLNLNIVRICKNASKEDSTNDILNVIDAGPREFLGWFHNASFALTTSFHGACFSLNFNVPFYSILKPNKANNSRQISLLSELGLEDRILYVENEKPSAESLGIQFDKVNVILDRKREESITFLKNSIEGTDAI